MSAVAESKAGGRPRICFLALNAYPILARSKSLQFAGGAEVQQVLIARNLARRGYEVCMICLDVGQDPETVIDGITVLRAFKADAGLPIMRYFVPRLTSVWSQLKQANADIYYHRAASHLTGIVALFGKVHKRKSIFAVAGEPKIRFRRDRMLYEYGVRRVDQVVVQNSEQRQQIRKRFGRDGVQFGNIVPQPETPHNDGRYGVLWVGTIRNVKRPKLFVELARGLPNMQFTMIGGPDAKNQGLFDSIRDSARSVQNLNFVGFVPYAEVDAYFDNAKLLVNTSFSEGFPNTFLQAWVRGIATISTVDCGARIGNEVVGKVVESPEHLMTNVKQLLEDDTARTVLGQQCREYVTQNHDTDLIVDRYEELFRSLQS